MCVCVCVCLCIIHFCLCISHITLMLFRCDFYYRRGIGRYSYLSGGQWLASWSPKRIVKASQSSSLTGRVVKFLHFMATVRCSTICRTNEISSRVCLAFICMAFVACFESLDKFLVRCMQKDSLRTLQKKKKTPDRTPSCTLCVLLVLLLVCLGVKLFHSAASAAVPLI